MEPGSPEERAAITDMLDAMLETGTPEAILIYFKPPNMPRRLYEIVKAYLQPKRTRQLALFDSKGQ